MLQMQEAKYLFGGWCKMLLSLLLLHEDLLLHVLGIAGQTVGVEVVVAMGLCEGFFLLSKEKGIFEGFIRKECNHPAELGFYFHVSGIHRELVLVLAEPPTSSLGLHLHSLSNYWDTASVSNVRNTPDVKMQRFYDLFLCICFCVTSNVPI